MGIFGFTEMSQHSHVMQSPDSLASKVALTDFSIFMDGKKIQWKKHTRKTVGHCQYWTDMGYIHMIQLLCIFFFPVTLSSCPITWPIERKCLSIALLLTCCVTSGSFFSLPVSVLRPSWFFFSWPSTSKQEMLLIMDLGFVITTELSFCYCLHNWKK